MDATGVGPDVIMKTSTIPQSMLQAIHSLLSTRNDGVDGFEDNTSFGTLLKAKSGPIFEFKYLNGFQGRRDKIVTYLDTLAIESSGVISTNTRGGYRRLVPTELLHLAVVLTALTEYALDGKNTRGRRGIVSISSVVDRLSLWAFVQCVPGQPPWGAVTKAEVSHILSPCKYGDSGCMTAHLLRLLDSGVENLRSTGLIHLARLLPKTLLTIDSDADVRTDFINGKGLRCCIVPVTQLRYFMRGLALHDPRSISLGSELGAVASVQDQTTVLGIGCSLFVKAASTRSDGGDSLVIRCRHCESQKPAKQPPTKSSALPADTIKADDIVVRSDDESSGSVQHDINSGSCSDGGDDSDSTADRSVRSDDGAVETHNSSVAAANLVSDLASLRTGQSMRRGSVALGCEYLLVIELTPDASRALVIAIADHTNHAIGDTSTSLWLPLPPTVIYAGNGGLDGTCAARGGLKRGDLDEHFKHLRSIASSVKQVLIMGCPPTVPTLRGGGRGFAASPPLEQRRRTDYGSARDIAATSKDGILSALVDHATNAAVTIATCKGCNIVLDGSDTVVRCCCSSSRGAAHADCLLDPDADCSGGQCTFCVCMRIETGIDISETPVDSMTVSTDLDGAAIVSRRKNLWIILKKYGLAASFHGWRLHMRKRELRNILASIRRQLRNGFTVNADLFAVFERYCRNTRYFTHLFVQRDHSATTILRLHFLCVPRSVIEGLASDPALCQSQFDDLTHKLLGTARFLSGWVHFVGVRAGGAALTGVFGAYLQPKAAARDAGLDENDIEADDHDLAEFLAKMVSFLRGVRGKLLELHDVAAARRLEVLPFSLGMSDKCKSQAMAFLYCAQRTLHEALPQVEALVLQLLRLATGASITDLSAAAMLLPSLPSFVAAVNPEPPLEASVAPLHRWWGAGWEVYAGDLRDATEKTPTSIDPRSKHWVRPSWNTASLRANLEQIVCAARLHTSDGSHSVREGREQCDDLAHISSLSSRVADSLTAPPVATVHQPHLLDATTIASNVSSPGLAPITQASTLKQRSRLFYLSMPHCQQIPIMPRDLIQLVPNWAPQPVDATQFDNLFCPELRAYGSAARGIALAGVEALLAVIPRLLQAQDVGSWDLDQSRLAWLRDITRGSANKLLLAIMTHFQACSWHDGENIKKELHAKVRDSALHRTLTRLYHSVLNGKVPPEQYAILAPDDTPPAWITYLRENQFSSSLLPRLDHRLRSLVDAPPGDTNNVAERDHNVAKSGNIPVAAGEAVEHFAGKSLGDGSDAFSARLYRDYQNIIAGHEDRPQYAARDELMDGVIDISTRHCQSLAPSKSGPPVTPFIRVVEALSYEGLPLLLEVGYDLAGFGHDKCDPGPASSKIYPRVFLEASKCSVLAASSTISASYTREFRPLSLQKSSLASDISGTYCSADTPVLRLSKSEVRKAFPRVKDVKVDDGRSSKQRIAVAVAAAHRAAKGPAKYNHENLDMQLIANKVASLAKSAPDFEIFVPLNKAEIINCCGSCVASLPTQAVTYLADAIKKREESLASVASFNTSGKSQNVPSLHPPAAIALQALLATYARVKESDFYSLERSIQPAIDGKSTVPHVSVLYIWRVSLRAKAVLSEGQRRMSAAYHRRSNQTGDELPVGFLVALFAAMREAESLVSAGRSDDFLDIIYVGQELRGDAKERFVRFLAHFTTGGSPVLYELCSRTHDCYCVPLATNTAIPVGTASPETMREKVASEFRLTMRIVAFLPPRADMINVFEAGLVLLLHWLGLLLANESPPCAPDGSRFFESVAQLTPQMVRTGRRWVASVGGPAAADKILPGNIRWPWLRRALVPFDVLLQNGVCVMPGGQVALPSLQHGDSRCFSALQCLDALLAGRATEVRLVAPWCNGCSCRNSTRLCSCLLSVELLSAKLLRPRQLQTYVLEMFRRSTIGQVELFAQVDLDPSASGITGTKPESLALAESIASYAALSLVMPMLARNFSGCTELSAARLSALRRTESALLNQVRVEWEATVSTSGGGRVSRRRAKTKADVHDSDCHSAVAPVSATAPTTGLGALLHYMSRGLRGIASGTATSTQAGTGSGSGSRSLPIRTHWQSPTQSRTMIDSDPISTGTAANFQSVNHVIDVPLVVAVAEPQAGAAATGSLPLAVSAHNDSDSELSTLLRAIQDIDSATLLNGVQNLVRDLQFNITGSGVTSSSSSTGLESAIQAGFLPTETHTSITGAGGILANISRSANNTILLPPSASDTAGLDHIPLLALFNATARASGGESARTSAARLRVATGKRRRRHNLEGVSAGSSDSESSK